MSKKKKVSEHGPSLEQIVEAIVFASEKPVKLSVFKDLINRVSGQDAPGKADIESAVASLNKAFEANGRVIRIKSWAGGYQMVTEPQVEPYLRLLFEERSSRRLSKSLMEALAIIAYRQPMSKPQIDFIRGVDSGYALKRLLEQDFVHVVGRSEAVGRPLLYGTTERFLEQFGLESLDALPKISEIAELVEDPEIQKETLKLLGGVMEEDPGDSQPAATES